MPQRHIHEFMRQLRAGDAAAFETLVREHAAPMRNVARRILGEADEVDDVVKEAFRAAYRSAGNCPESGQLGTWLHRIAIGCALIRLRSRREGNARLPNELMPRFESNGVFSEPPPAWRSSAGSPDPSPRALNLTRSHIDGLPDGYRVALVLRDVEGLSDAELAQQLGASVHDARTRVHHARQALSSLLAQSLHGERT